MANHLLIGGTKNNLELAPDVDVEDLREKLKVAALEGTLVDVEGVIEGAAGVVMTVNLKGVHWWSVVVLGDLGQ